MSNKEENLKSELTQQSAAPLNGTKITSSQTKGKNQELGEVGGKKAGMLESLFMKNSGNSNQSSVLNHSETSIFQNGFDFYEVEGDGYNQFYSGSSNQDYKFSLYFIKTHLFLERKMSSEILLI